MTKTPFAKTLNAPITRRRSLDFLAGGGLAAIAANLPGGAYGALRQPKDDVVRIGYIPITDATPLLVAHAKGYFADEGLEAAKPTLIRGWSTLVEGFAAGRFNLLHLLKPIPIWMRYNNNFPVKIMAWCHTNGSGVVAGKHVKASGFKDLAGRQVAVPFWYSMHNVVLQMALRHVGLTPVIRDQKAPLAPNEVNLLVMPPPDMPPALAAKKIDAYIVAEPFNAAGELLAGARMIRFTGDIWKNHPCCVVCMHEDDASQRPEWTQKVINAVVRAEIFASENKREVAHLLSRDGAKYLPMPANVVERAMTFYDPADYAEPQAIRHAEWGNGRIDFSPWPYPSATKLIVSAMNETLVSGDTAFLSKLDPEFVARDLVDYNFVRNAMKTYPGWQNGPGVDPANPFEREEVIAI